VVLVGERAAADYRYTGPLPICFGGLFRALDAEARAGLGLGSGSGAVEVVSLPDDSVGARAGLRAGDVIVRFEGEPIGATDPVEDLRARAVPLKQRGNASAKVGILRGGRAVEVTVFWP
jgi:S1-C subfamily serine protease